MITSDRLKADVSLRNQAPRLRPPVSRPARQAQLEVATGMYPACAPSWASAIAYAVTERARVSGDNLPPVSVAYLVACAKIHPWASVAPDLYTLLKRVQIRSTAGCEYANPCSSDDCSRVPCAGLYHVDDVHGYEPGGRSSKTAKYQKAIQDEVARGGVLTSGFLTEGMLNYTGDIYARQEDSNDGILTSSQAVGRAGVIVGYRYERWHSQMALVWLLWIPGVNKSSPIKYLASGSYTHGNSRFEVNNALGWDATIALDNESSCGPLIFKVNTQEVPPLQKTEDQNNLPLAPTRGRSRTPTKAPSVVPPFTQSIAEPIRASSSLESPPPRKFSWSIIIIAVVLVFFILVLLKTMISQNDIRDPVFTESQPSKGVHINVSPVFHPPP